MPSEAPSRQETLRQPLGEVTTRKNAQTTPAKQQQQASRQSPSSPLAPHHHQSLKVGNLNVHYPDGAPDNKRISALTNESRDTKRDSNASSSSTNGSGGRQRKRHIGPWLLGSTLGTGATGRVRKARHVVTGQLAAVKVVSKRTAIDLRSQSVMQMDRRLAVKPWHSDRKHLPFGIEREVVIMKIIGHPNIIKLFDLWENRGELYLVMEYVEGGELFSYIVQNRFLDEPEAVRIFRQIISAVGYCHEFKVCHRDIKPENILLDSIGNVKLVDFGMASREHHEGLQTSCGSPHYAPPEIAMGQKYRGAQADIWSCGIVLYVMLVGQLPFGTAYTVPEEVRQVLSEVIKGEIELPQELSDDAADLICRMLEHFPHNRISINDIWNHPLLVYYEPYTRDPEHAERWIGGPPTPLTSNICGGPFTKREDIDLDILRGVCTLWHSNDQERMIANLMSLTPNHQKVVYQNLLRHRIEQEENYQGVSIEFSGSDYHHVARRPIRRTVTRSSLLGPGQKRSSSQFSIAEPPKTKHLSTKSRGGASDADTEMSYDPFRPSRQQMIPVEADHAKITLLNGSSMSSKREKYTGQASSLRHPAVARLQQEHSCDMRSSPPFVPRDADGRIRELRRKSVPRQNTSSSWASTISSREGSRVFRKSASYKRQVQFPHRYRNSSLQQSPPPRPRNPTPLTLQQKYVLDADSSDRDPFTSSPPGRANGASMSPPQIRSRKEAVSTQVADDETKKKNRSSSIWEERTRQVSVELSNLCDEVFEGKTAEPDLFNKETAVEKLRTFARKSLDLPAFRSSEVKSSGLEPSSQSRPLPQPPSFESKAMQTYLELAQTKERLEEHAKALGSNELDEVIQQIGRLMAAEAVKVAEQDRKRIVSAPLSRGHDFQELSPVREEDEVGRSGADSGPRHVSEPVKSSRYNQSLQNVDAWRAWNYPSTIRPVDDSELRPRPLTIRKKTSEPVMRPPISPPKKEAGHALKGRLKAGNASTSALDKLFGSSTKAGHGKSKSGDGVAISRLAPIGEHDDKENLDPQDVKRASNESKGHKWFRRSAGSTRSSNSGSAHDSIDRQHVLTNSQQSNHISDGRSRGTTNTTCDDFPFRQAAKETKSTTSKILKFFGKRDKRMQIAMTDQENDSWYGDTATSDSQSASAYAHGALLDNPASVNTHTEHNDRTFQKRRTHFGSLPHPPTAHDSSDAIPSATTPAHSWFARLLHVKPAKRILCLTITRDRAVREIHSVLRDWRRYGVREINVDKTSSRISAVVGEDNTLGVKPVTLLCEVFPVAMKGRAAGMAVARFSQVKGAKSSFSRAADGMEGVLRGRGIIVKKKRWGREMRRCLREWESGMG